MSDPHNEREVEVARQIERIKAEKLTGKIELSFKNGELVAGKLEFPFLK